MGSTRRPAHSPACPPACLPPCLACPPACLPARLPAWLHRTLLQQPAVYPTHPHLHTHTHTHTLWCAAAATGGRRGTREQCLEAAARALAGGASVVVDRTGVTQDQRRPFVRLAQQHGVQVGGWRVAEGKRVAGRLGGWEGRGLQRVHRATGGSPGHQKCLLRALCPAALPTEPNAVQTCRRSRARGPTAAAASRRTA